MSEIHRTARSGAPVTGEDPDLMIRLTNVSKVYRLGEIGSGTLYRDLQSWQAKRKGLPDPNRKIGHESLLSNEPFFALKDIDLSVRKGECLGIIGGNGAGKSTLLKLISRVTGPSAGEIDLYGRVTSMLEVGTGKCLSVRGIMFCMSEGISTKPYASPPRILPESRYRTAPSGFIRIRTMPM